MIQSMSIRPYIKDHQTNIRFGSIFLLTITMKAILQRFLYRLKANAIMAKLLFQRKISPWTTAISFTQAKKKISNTKKTTFICQKIPIRHAETLTIGTISSEAFPNQGIENVKFNQNLQDIIRLPSLTMNLKKKQHSKKITQVIVKGNFHKLLILRKLRKILTKNV